MGLPQPNDVTLKVGVDATLANRQLAELDSRSTVKAKVDTAAAEKKLAELEAQYAALHEKQQAVKPKWSLAGTLAEGDGTPSMSRLISLIGSLVWFGLLIARYHRTGQMPSPAELASGFAGANVPYIANQLKRVLEPLAGRGQKSAAGNPESAGGVQGGK